MRIALSVFLVLMFHLGAAAGQLTLRIGYETPRSDTVHQGATHMAQLLKDRSGGQINLRMFPDSTLGTGQAMINQVRDGTLDMYVGGSGNFTDLEGKLNVLDIPFLFDNTDIVDLVLDSELGDEMLATLERHDLKALAFWENGFRNLTNNRNAVGKPADVVGLKIRTLATPMHIKAWTLLGTNPVPMALAELYTALETKTVEAQEHPINVTWNAKLYEVQKFLSLTRHAYSPLIFVMNKDKFEKLTPEQQKLIRDAAREGGQFQRKYVRDNEAGFIEKIREAGLQVTYDVDQKAFRDIIEKDVRQMYIDTYGDEWLVRIDGMIGK